MTDIVELVKPLFKNKSYSILLIIILCIFIIVFLTCYFTSMNVFLKEVLIIIQN